MSEYSRTCASLRVFGNSLDTNKLSEKCEVKPSLLVRDHRVIASKNSQRVGKHHPSKFAWSVSDENPERNLDQKVLYLLSQLKIPADEWRKIISEARADMFCGIWVAGNQGGGLSVDAMGRLAELGIELDLDIYSSDENGDG